VPEPTWLVPVLVLIARVGDRDQPVSPNVVQRPLASFSDEGSRAGRAQLIAALAVFREGLAEDAAVFPPPGVSAEHTIAHIDERLEQRERPHSGRVR
jgi:hypothetical protein